MLHQPPGKGEPAAHAELRIHGPSIRYVRLPEGTDTKELFKARLQAMERGRKFGAKRVKKVPQPKPMERFTPLVSDRVTEAEPT